MTKTRRIRCTFPAKVELQLLKAGAFGYRLVANPLRAKTTLVSVLLKANELVGALLGQVLQGDAGSPACRSARASSKTPVVRKLLVAALAVAFAAATAGTTTAAAPQAVRLDCGTRVLALVFLPGKRLVDIGDAVHRRLLVADPAT